MAAILQSLPRTVIAGFVLVVLVFLAVADATFDMIFYQFLFRWLHVLSGVMWIGLLWYFNFVQIPNMPNIPDEQKPAIGKVIAPAALFWFRWGAMATIITGLILAMISGYLVDAITLRGNGTVIGIGMTVKPRAANQFSVSPALSTSRRVSRGSDVLRLIRITSS